MSTVEKMPWYFLVCQDEKTYAFGVKTGANALCHFTYADGLVTLAADVRAASQPLRLSGRTLNVCEFVSSVYTCKAFEALGLFCKKMCPNPRTINKPVFGGNDWYCNYGNTSYEKILEHSRRIALCAKGLPVKPYMVIDDGWQLCRFKGFSGGPWTKSNDNFEDMKALGVDSIFVGHEHCNSASVVYEGVRLQYGQKSSEYDRFNAIDDYGKVVESIIYDPKGKPIVGGSVIILSQTGEITNAYIYYCK
jgi:hypothetical protein